MLNCYDKPTYPLGVGVKAGMLLISEGVLFDYNVHVGCTPLPVRFASHTLYMYNNQGNFWQGGGQGYMQFVNAMMSLHTIHWE